MAESDSENAASSERTNSLTAGPPDECQEMEQHPAWPMISRLPVMLAVSVPMSGFRVTELLNLRTGQTIMSGWAVTEDVPLKVGPLQVGWGEFEVVEQQMALRLTRLA
jgi:flagellar motor switch/type III secretory pathway protein FliN